MAFDTDLADRLRQVVAGPGVREQRMFGGLAFLVDGHLAVAAGSRGGLLLRADPVRVPELLDEPRVRRFEMRGRELDGWLFVDDSVVGSDEALRTWAGIGVAYARTLPPKR